ncbi:MAG: ABC transporter ATP-binding protein [Deltaproteobacteria bacterium]|nr:ABC transporter ATP-binding protein [Deltaproteobacteria bacterium]
MEAIVRLSGAERSYGTGFRTTALHPTDLEVRRGELVVVLGPSGSGKTTLLNLIGGLDRPTTGRVEVDGEAVSSLPPAAQGEFRRRKVGFVFQFFNLIPTLTARENVAFAVELAGVAADIDGLLREVGLEGREDRFPAELSGGEQQRVAIVRALAKRPALLLCDEPTGALDVETGKQVLALLARQARDEKRTVVIVTHNSAVAALGDRVVRLRDGKVVTDERNERPAAAEELAW